LIILKAMNHPDTATRSNDWRSPAAIAFAAWLVIELLFIGQVMHTDSFDLWEAIKITLPRSAMWLFFAPLAVALAFLFPLERGRLMLSGAAHLAACALLLAASHHVMLSFWAGSRNGIGEPASSGTASVRKGGNASRAAPDSASCSRLALICMLRGAC
jgi:hypothetical protein